jgi:hypothetical protein
MTALGAMPLAPRSLFVVVVAVARIGRKRHAGTAVPDIAPLYPGYGADQIGW